MNKDAAQRGNPGQKTPSPEIFDLYVPADKIRYFAKLDLGQLVDLPTTREDLAALSIRMNAVFRSLWKDTFQLVVDE